MTEFTAAQRRAIEETGKNAFGQRRGGKRKDDHLN